MIDTPFYVIVRRAKPGNLRDQDRYLSLTHGWTNKPVFARTFATEAAAKEWLHGRAGEVVTAESIGLDLKGQR